MAALNLHEYQVTASEAEGQRLDRWLAEQQEEFSRSQIQKLIDQGQVQVNGSLCALKKYEVRCGDLIQVTVPPSIPMDLAPEFIPLDILYEDESLLILNKPAGLVVHPAPGHETGTLVHALLAHCQSEDGLETSLSGIGGVQRPGIVHRLDKDTSGALVIAKTDRVHQHLQAQIQAKTAQREYLGVVYGKPPADSGLVDRPIGRNAGDRKRMAIIPTEAGGRSATTYWQVQERLGNFSVVHFRLGTGRTHQIRVHCLELGCPIVGDPLYGKGRSLGVNLTGQLLHAWRLTLDHPITGIQIQVEAPLPPEFLKALQYLKQRHTV
jgi:23S rRNA pseudouridine1911/1915/1917 synthase